MAASRKDGVRRQNEIVTVSKMIFHRDRRSNYSGSSDQGTRRIVYHSTIQIYYSLVENTVNAGQ